MDLDSPYIVKERYLEKNRNYNTDFKCASQNGKLKINQDILNVIVEPKQYSKVIKFRTGEAALQNMGTRLENILTNEDNSRNNVHDGANCQAAKLVEKWFKILLKILLQKKQDKRQMIYN